MKNIFLNNSTEIDLAKLIDSKLLIQANSGGGKSWAIRRILEQSYGKVQHIILDPEGEFSTLREKYDYILAGKDGDIPADSRTAALLARKVLEHKFSIIIDLYEMHPQERKHFVKLFLESLVNAPKNLWNNVLVVIDEAHVFVPEKGESEAANAVIGLASLGRKRGFCAILATQRISKLHKDAAAECNNKLIGRTGLDIDRKRASEELGFTSKEQNLSLRSLEPGSFFAFGPAISNEIIEVKVGEVVTSHPKAGAYKTSEVAQASDSVKKILAKLSDLPQEAKKEANTIQELKNEIRSLKAHRCPKVEKQGFSEQDQQKIVEKASKLWEEGVLKKIRPIERYQKEIIAMIKKMNELPTPPLFEGTVKETVAVKVPLPLDIPRQQVNDPGLPKGFQRASFPASREEKVDRARNMGIEIPEEKKYGKCSKAIYSYLSQRGTQGATKTQIAIATGYSQNSSSFSNSLSELSAAGLIIRAGNSAKIADYSREDLRVEVDTSIEKWLGKLGMCSRKILELILNHHSDEAWTKAQISVETGYSLDSSSFSNSLSELSALGLIERMPGGIIVINPEILDL